MPEDPRAPGSAPPCAGSRITRPKAFCGGGAGSAAGCAGAGVGAGGACCGIGADVCGAGWTGVAGACVVCACAENALGGRHHPQDNQANRFAGHSHEDTRIVPILRDPPRSISLVLQTKCHLTDSLCGSRLQRLEKGSLMSSRAKRGICFFANRKKKADSSGNPRPRNHKFGIFPQTVQPRQSDDFKTWALLRAAFLMSYVDWPFSAIFEAFWAEGGGHYFCRHQ